MLGRHDEVAAVSTQHAAVEGAGFGNFTVDGEVELAGRILGERDVLGCSERDLAADTSNRTGILHSSCMQSHEAALSLDCACVDDLSRGVVAERQRQRVFAISEILHGFIADFGRRSDEGAYIHAGIPAEQHAVRIDDVHAAIGRELAIDDGSGIARHAVQRDGTSIRLLELDFFTILDVKAFPVDGQTIGLLVNSHRLVVRARDVAFAGADRTVLRHGVSNPAKRHGHKSSCQSCGLAVPSSTDSAFHRDSFLYRQLACR